MSHFSRGLVDLKYSVDVGVDVGDEMLLLLMLMMLLFLVAVAVAGGGRGACPRQRHRRHDGVCWR